MDNCHAGKLVYEIMMKVKATRQAEFEEHCKKSVQWVQGHKGYHCASFSSRNEKDDKDHVYYRVEMIFDNQDSLDSYQKDVVPKVREGSTNFGDDAKVIERRVHNIFFVDCPKK